MDNTGTNAQLDLTLAYVSTILMFINQIIVPPFSDWAAYEGLKTAFIPGYSPYPVFQADSNPPSLNAEIHPKNESQVQLAGRYAMCSAAGMSTAAAITNPLDVVRTRWQTSGGYMSIPTPSGDVTNKATLPGMIQQIWRQAGWRGFMRGAAIRVMYYVGRLHYAVSACAHTVSLAPAQIPSNVRSVLAFPVHILNYVSRSYL